MNDKVELQTRKPKNTRVLGSKAANMINSAIFNIQIVREKLDVLKSPFRTKEEYDKTIKEMELAAAEALIALLMVPKIEADELATAYTTNNGG